MAQLGAFKGRALEVNSKRRSLANSAGIMLGTDYHFDLTRPGLSLYGGKARSEMQGKIAPVVSIEASILQVRQLQDGDAVGYNATHHCNGPTSVATLSIGYADGFLRAFSGKGTVSVSGVTLPLIGRVSMDLVTADISAVPDLVEGDWVSIDYDLAAASDLTGLSQYELLTNLGERFQRIWH